MGGGTARTGKEETGKLRVERSRGSPSAFAQQVVPNHTQDEERSVPQSPTHSPTGYLFPTKPFDGCSQLRARRLPSHFLEAASWLLHTLYSTSVGIPSLSGQVYSVAQSRRRVRSHTSQASWVLHQRDTVLKNSATDTWDR